mgnify:FL=1|tara:strand:- start:686 stop:1018 length:333 start_codon:yes stop_codon:yes gene_type:complete
MRAQSDSKTNQQSTPNKAEIIRMMEDFDSSKNVSVKEFCEMHEITAATFREWHYIYENREQHNGQSGGFVSLDVMETGEGQSNPSLLFAEVQGIRLYREVPPSYLKALLS